MLSPVGGLRVRIRLPPAASQERTGTLALSICRHCRGRLANCLAPVMRDDEKTPKPVHYPRNPDLDPQLVWRGKDGQDWSELIVQAPPLYIQEKIHLPGK